MTRSLLEDIQALLERTYAPAGIGLADCVIGPSRARVLGRAAGLPGPPDHARTFLRSSGGILRVAIYFPSGLVENLERHDPRAGLSEANIAALVSFVEEINHAVHAALAFQRGEPPRRDPDYIWNLELQALVDTWLVLMFFAAFFRGAKGLGAADRAWLRRHIVGTRAGRARRDASWRQTYELPSRLAGLYIRQLGRLPPARRLREIRTFHTLDFAAKRERILRRDALRS